MGDDGKPTLRPSVKSQDKVEPDMLSDRLENTIQAMEVWCSSIRAELLGTVEEVKAAVARMGQTITQEREARVKSFVELEARLEERLGSLGSQLDKRPRDVLGDIGKSQDVFELHAVMQDHIGHHNSEIQGMRSAFSGLIQKLEQRLDAMEWRNECASFK